MAHTIRRTPALAAFFAGQPVEPIGYLPNGRPVFPIAGGSDDPPADPAPTDPPADPAPTDDPPTDPQADPAPSKVTLTPEQQAHVDKVISDRLSKEKTKYEQQLKEMRDSAGKTEVEKLTAERDRLKEQAETGGKTAAQRLAKSEAKVAAMAAGARPDRVAAIIAQAKLDDALDDDNDVDETKVAAAVAQVLKDFPEWKGTATRSGGDLDGDQGTTKSFTEKQIEAMSPEEYDKNSEDILAAMAAGRITKG